MNQVLTQAEVDALLSAVAEGSSDVGGQTTEAASTQTPGGGGGGSGGGGSPWGETSVQPNDPEVTPYDLTNQDRVIRGRMPTLDIIYERFIRLYRMSLSNSLRKIATISIISTDLLKFGEFVK